MAEFGTFRGGVVVPDSPHDIPDGTRVRYEAIPANAESNLYPDGKSLLADFEDLIVDCPDLPSDLSTQHDHYRLGVPKR
jgi:hypothetical protein